MDWDPQATDTHGYICPPCPVFYPTLEQFKNPLKYISSIRHIGEQAGICKIVPPAGWRPPFAINEKTFKFRTRVQQLNCIDGHSRAEGNFVESLRMFLYRNGTPMKELPRVDGQLVNLHSLYKTVAECGGYDRVCATSLWSQVVRRVGRTLSADQPKEEICRAYQMHYETSLLAYERQETASLRTPEVSKKMLADNRSGRTTASSTMSSTPHTKTRSTMKKQERDTAGQGDEETQSNDDDVADGSPDSKRVKRTLFSEGGHTSSEENEPHAADVKTGVGCTTPGRMAGSKGDRTMQVKKEMKVFDDSNADEPLEDPSPAIPGNLEPSALKPDTARKYRLDAPEIYAGQKFYHFLPDCGAALAQVKRVFGGKKPHVAIQYVKDGSRESIDLSTMQIIIANGWNPCNGGHHLFCLDTPLEEVPSGDWYCDACVEESYSDERDTNPKFGFEMGSEYNVVAYKEKADAWKRNYFGLQSDEEAEKLTDLELEKEYWRLLSIPVHEQRLEVEYGSDVDTGSVGSGFPRVDSYLKCLRFVTKRLKNVTMNGKNDYIRQMSEFFSHGLKRATESGMSLETLLRTYANDDWNLNNLPKLSGSVLQHLDEDIKGVMVPWIYMGMCFSTFCWHVEDHNFYSMSYNHCGAPKTWYGVPCGKADHFEETMKKLTPELFGSQPDLHLQLVTMFSPEKLIEHGVPVYRATHRPNEFMVTFPSAYHGGFNNGFNCAEAVNFATVDWIPWGAKSVQKYRKFSKLPVFSHEALICSLAETLVESSKFDYDTAADFLYPAMKQIHDDFVQFEERIASQNVTTHEWMAEFEERHHSASGSGVPVRASKKRMMSTSGDCGEHDDPVKSSSFVRTTKMSMSSSNSGTKMAITTRPTRMVLWAGQSGKNEGLRCVTCNQYCYLQAVVCTKCRHHSTVGCVEHYATMCDCDSTKHYLYLHRYDAPHLASLLQSMQSRLKQVEEWNGEYNCVFMPKRDEQPGKTMTKPKVLMLKKLLSNGLKCGGANQDQLDMIECAIQSAVRWTEKADKLIQHQQTTHEAIQLEAVLDLSAAAEGLAVLPEKYEQVEELLRDWHECKRAADSILSSVAVVQQQESTSASSFNIRDPRDSEGLWHENKQHQLTIASIGEWAARIDAMGLGLQDSIASRLRHARQYLEVLVSANAVVTIIAKSIERSRTASRTWQPSQAQSQAPVTENACRLVVDSADNLNLGSETCMFKVEMLRSFLKVTEAEAIELQAVLSDHSKSTEELEVVLNRLKNLPVYPNQLLELSERLNKCRAWEAKAKQMVALIPGIPNQWSREQQMLLSQQLASRPALEEVEAFYDQADERFVPTTSLLRRQIHGRIQDCRRWYSAVHSLFEKPTDGERGLAGFLRAAITKFHSQYSPKEHPHSRLHCVCQQVLSDKASTITCQRCSSHFHIQCIDHYPVAEKAGPHVARSFVCDNCQPTYHRTGHEHANSGYPGSLHLRATLGSQGVPLFCLCRGGEDSSMICCDFCDEWYHSACIDMSFEVMNQIEAYRCPRCAIKQNLYYLDKKSMRKDHLGRRPAFARIEAFLTQLQTSLIALPPGALELVEYIRLVQQVEMSAKAYVQGFASAFSPEIFARMNYQAEEQKLMVLMHQVTDLEVSLDGVQGSLGAIHWCLRACRMVLGCEHAPKYSHLVVLLDDTKRSNFTFPRVEYYHIQMTIEDRVHKASLWLKQVKTLEVEEWNIEKARRLLREYQELRQFLDLPVAEVNLVHQTIANGNAEDEFVTDKKRRLI